MIYPIIVVVVATLILTFIMIFIVPTFETMFEEFGLTLPPPTVLLIAMSNYISGYWFLLIAMPICADPGQADAQVPARTDGL